MAQCSHLPGRSLKTRPTLATSSAASCSTKCVNWRRRGQPCRARASSSCRVSALADDGESPEHPLRTRPHSLCHSLASPSLDTTRTQPYPPWPAGRARRRPHSRGSAPSRSQQAPPSASPPSHAHGARIRCPNPLPKRRRAGTTAVAATCFRGQAAMDRLRLRWVAQRVRKTLPVLLHPSAVATKPPPAEWRALRRAPLFPFPSGTSGYNMKQLRVLDAKPRLI